MRVHQDKYCVRMMCRALAVAPIELALAEMADDIVTFCKRSRRHGHLEGVSPEQFEAGHERGATVSTESWKLHRDARPVVLGG